jgi:anti-sigma factor RsiW
MNCKQTQTYMHSFQDKDLNDAESAAFQLHLNGCAECREIFHKEEEIIIALRTLPVPPPSKDFVTRSIAMARATHRKQRMKQTTPYWGGALAACLALLLLIYGPVHQVTPLDPSGSQQAINLKLDEQRLVQVIVNVPRDMLQADVVIELPPQVEVAGYPGLREIRWNTNLHKGKNLLRLPLIAKAEGSAELVTHVTHENKSKILSLVMNISQDGLSKSGHSTLTLV